MARSDAPRAAVAVAALPLVAALLSGCADTDPPLPEARASEQPSVTAERARADAPPATTSGRLSRESLPAPSSLGHGWRYRVDPEDPEEGVGGNGTPATARDPREVVAVLSPLGCRPAALPLPHSALEVTYAHPDGRPAVGLLLEFTSPARATTFAQARAEAMRACAAWPQATADVVVLQDAPTLFVSVRDEQVGDTPVWTEGVRRRGDRVLFVAVMGGDDTSLRSVTHALR